MRCCDGNWLWFGCPICKGGPAVEMVLRDAQHCDAERDEYARRAREVHRASVNREALHPEVTLEQWARRVEQARDPYLYALRLRAFARVVGETW